MHGIIRKTCFKKSRDVWDEIYMKANLGSQNESWKPPPEHQFSNYHLNNLKTVIASSTFPYSQKNINTGKKFFKQRTKY